MRRMICIIFSIINCLSLTSCYCDLEEDSLEEYIEYIKINKFGNSNTGIDHPDYFIPNITFFDEYNYIDGGYHWRADDSFRGLLEKEIYPEIALLFLKYDEAIYYDVKQYMLESMPVYNDEYYVYNNYNFYIHENFINRFSDDFPMPQFPYSFNMASYNDLNMTLLFIGFFDQYPRVDEKYYDDFKSNFPELLVTYYGEYYDFEK